MINEDFDKDHQLHKVALDITEEIIGVISKIPTSDIKDKSKWIDTMLGKTFIADMYLDKKIKSYSLPKISLCFVDENNPALASVASISNGMTFLILSVLSTSSINKTIKNIEYIKTSRYWAENIYHEVIHLMQLSSYPQGALKGNPDNSTKDFYSKYFNSPLEFDAYFQQLSLDFMRIYTIIKNDRQNYDKYMDMYKLSDNFKNDLKNRFLKVTHKSVELFLDNINNKRYKRLIKRLYNIHKAILALKPDNLSESIEYDDPLWHGSYTNGLVAKIAKNGVKGRDIQGMSDLAPIKGKVYMTPKMGYALMYALGGDIAGTSGNDGRIKPGERYGYMLKFDPSEVSNPHPDEDEIGQLFTYAYNYSNGKKIYNEDIQQLFDQYPSIARNMGYIFDAYTKSTKQLRAKALDGDYGSWAKVGKKIIREYPHSDELFSKIMNLFKSHVAVDEGIKPLEIWRFDRRNTPKLKRDGSNFFDYAKKVWSRT